MVQEEQFEMRKFEIRNYGNLSFIYVHLCRGEETVILLSFLFNRKNQPNSHSFKIILLILDLGTRIQCIEKAFPRLRIDFVKLTSHKKV